MTGWNDRFKSLNVKFRDYGLMLATVLRGPRDGTLAAGVATTTKNIQRASNWALALAAVRKNPQILTNASRSLVTFEHSVSAQAVSTDSTQTVSAQAKQSKRPHDDDSDDDWGQWKNKARRPQSPATPPPYKKPDAADISR